eukprot:9426886-Pyramimonas_sp.AAC.1
MGCLCILLNSHLVAIAPAVAPSLCMYGFSQGRKTHEVTPGLKSVCRHVRSWGKEENVVFASLDVATAFDSLTVQVASSTLE